MGILLLSVKPNTVNATYSRSVGVVTDSAHSRWQCLRVPLHLRMPSTLKGKTAYFMPARASHYYYFESVQNVAGCQNVGTWHERWIALLFHGFPRHRPVFPKKVGVPSSTHTHSLRRSRRTVVQHHRRIHMCTCESRHKCHSQLTRYRTSTARFPGEA